MKTAASNHHVRKSLGREGQCDRPCDRIGSAQDRDLPQGCSTFNQVRRLRGNGCGLGVSVRAAPELDLGSWHGRDQLFGEPVAVVPDQRGGRRHNASRASPVSAHRHRASAWKAGDEPFEAGAGRPSKAIDRLIVVADDERLGFRGDELDQAFLRKVQVLVLVDEHVSIARGVLVQELRVFLEHPDGEHEQVLEVEEAALPAFAIVGAKQPDTRAHQVTALRVVAGRRPGGKPADRNQLLLHTLEHLQCGPNQVVWTLVTGQSVVSELPHELPGEDPAVGAGQDSKVGRHPHGAAVRTQPPQRDRVKSPHSGSRGADPVLDPLAHLRRGALGEGHDEDRRRRRAAGHQPAEALRDDRGLPRARARDHSDRTATDGRRRALLRSQPCVHCAGVEWPMRTRSPRTLRPSSRRFSRPRMTSESRRSW